MGDVQVDTCLAKILAGDIGVAVKSDPRGAIVGLAVGGRTDVGNRPLAHNPAELLALRGKGDASGPDGADLVACPDGGIVRSVEMARGRRPVPPFGIHAKGRLDILKPVLHDSKNPLVSFQMFRVIRPRRKAVFQKISRTGQ